MAKYGKVVMFVVGNANSSRNGTVGDGILR